MTLLTSRSSASGHLRALYLGRCRVGYVERRSPARWTWAVALVRPEGGHYFGLCSSEVEAQSAAEEAMREWLKCAGLNERMG